jgi:hypothetical protein
MRVRFVALLPATGKRRQFSALIGVGIALSATALLVPGPGVSLGAPEGSVLGKP